MRTKSTISIALLSTLLLLGGCAGHSTLQTLFSQYNTFRATLFQTTKFDPLYPFLKDSDATIIDSWVLERRQGLLEELKRNFLAKYPEGLKPVGLQLKDTEATLELQLDATAKKNSKSGRLSVNFVKEDDGWKLELGEYFSNLSSEENEFPDIKWVRKTARHGGYSLDCPIEPEVVVSETSVKWKFPRFGNTSFNHLEANGLNLDTQEKQFKYLEKLRKRANGNKILHSEFLLDEKKYGPRPGVEWQVEIAGNAVAKNRVFLLSENDSLLISGLYIPGTQGERIVNKYLDSLEFGSKAE